MSDRPAAFPIAHGIAWYPEDSEAYIFVTRMANLAGVAVLQVRTSAEDHPDRLTDIQIAVSKKGRSIRVYGPDGRQWKPEVPDDS